MRHVTAVATNPAAVAKAVSGPMYAIEDLRILAEKPTPANGWQTHPQLAGLRFLPIATLGGGGTTLYMLAPGARVPCHEHGVGGEHTLMLDGTITAGNFTLKAGESVFRGEGTIDEAATAGPTGALLVVTRQSPLKPLYQKPRQA